MEMVRDLTCPICLEFYTHPIILPCSHVLCRRPCAENLFDVNFIRCPVCRDNCFISGGITSLPRVITLESIIEKVSAERKQRKCDNNSKDDHDQTKASSSSNGATSSASSSSSQVHPDLDPRGQRFSPLLSSSMSSSFYNEQSSPRSACERQIPPTNQTSSAPPSNGTETIIPSSSSSIPTVTLSEMLARTAAYSQSQALITDNGSRGNSERDRNILSCVNTSPSSRHSGESRWETGPNSFLLSTSSVSNQSSKNSNVAPSRTVEGRVDTGQNPCVAAASRLSSQTAEIFGLPQSQGCGGMMNGRPGEVGSASHVTGREVVGTAGVTSSSRSTSSHDSGSRVHPGSINALDVSTVLNIKREIQSQLQKLCDVQCQLLVYLTSYKEKADRLRASLENHRTSINTQCDELVAVVETKRSGFLERVDADSRVTREETDDVMAATENLLTSTQQLACFAEQILEAKHDVLVESAPAILDRLASSVKDCQNCLVASEPQLRDILSHRIDLRNERCVLAGIEYLTVPSRPVIKVGECSRNTDTVALVLKPPSCRDVIESYEVIYCSEEQKRLGIEERYYARVPREENLSSGTGSVILIENLCRGSHYYFCACAVNSEGRSRPSEFVQCVTLSPIECVVPVPGIMDKQCHIQSRNATIVCPSPTTVTACQGVTHWLLRRRGGGASVWTTSEMSGKEEHSLSELQPSTEYEIAVIAKNERGECQISEKLSVTTL